MSTKIGRMSPGTLRKGKANDHSGLDEGLLPDVVRNSGDENLYKTKTVKRLGKALDELEDVVRSEVASVREMLDERHEGGNENKQIVELKQTIAQAFGRLSKMKEDILHGLDHFTLETDDKNCSDTKPRDKLNVDNKDVDAQLAEYLKDLKKY